MNIGPLHTHPSSPTERSSFRQHTIRKWLLFCAFLFAFLSIATSVHARDGVEPGFAPEPPPLYEPPQAPPISLRCSPGETLTKHGCVRLHRGRELGYVTVGAGFTSFEGFIFSGGIGSRSLFGIPGVHLALDTTLSQLQKQFELSHTLDMMHAPGFVQVKLEYNAQKWMPRDDSLQGVKIGGIIQAGWKFTKGWRVGVGYHLARHELEQTSWLQSVPWTTPNKGWSEPRVLSAIQFHVSYHSDRHQNRSKMLDAFRAYGDIEWAHNSLGSDFNYTKLEGGILYGAFIPKGMHLSISVRSGAFFAERSKDLPFFDRYRLQGPRNSGYALSIAGPQSVHNDVPFALGGSGYAYARNELRVPIALQVSHIRGKGLYAFGAIEGGMLMTGLGVDRQIFPNVTSSLGLLWNSFLGPMRLGVAFPIIRNPNEPKFQVYFSMNSDF